VVGSSWFGADASGLVIDSVSVGRPITFEVIGDPHSLEEAARFRGGLVSEITGPGIGGQVQIDQESRLVVDSLHATRENQYAQPASPPPPPPRPPPPPPPPPAHPRGRRTPAPPPTPR
jgi:uncharacterized protein YlxW (UPF0749 family)